MLTDITERLLSLGYTVVQGDNWVLEYISSKVESSIKGDCGVYDPLTLAIKIPDELHQIAVDRVCGEFLHSKKASGALVGFDLTATVKTIQEGDIKVDFGGSLTPEQRLDALINYLLNQGKGDIASHRKIKW